MAQEETSQTPSPSPTPSQVSPPVPGGAAKPLEMPKSLTAEVTLVSGMRGMIRQMRVKEMDFFADQMLLRSNKAVDRVLESCWIETLDPGPYPFQVGPIGKGNRVDWLKVAKVDREFFFIRLRQMTIGSDYDFDTRCDSIVCGQGIPWKLPLDDLPVEPMSPEGVSSLAGSKKEDRLLPFVFPQDGRACRWHVMTGMDEMRIAAKRDSKNQLRDLLTVRVDEIDGVNPNDRRRWLGNLAVPDQDAFLDATTTVEGGIDLVIPIDCPKCGKEVLVNLLLDAPFFLGKKGRRKRGVSSGEQ